MRWTILSAMFLCVCSAAVAEPSSATAPAASNGFVGWRGDGTGHYPDATPPTTWSKSADGKSKNILWQVKMPYYSFSQPIIVGDKLITRSEPYDLVCMDKNTGKVLWVRTHPASLAATEADKKNPLWKDVQKAAAQLQEVTDKVYAVGKMPTTAPAADLCEQKKKLQKQINDLMVQIDEKYTLPKDAWRGKWAGYTGPTPISDGKDIYASSEMGVFSCWDLEGKIKWAVWDQFPSTEHGCGATPILAGDCMIYYGLEMKGKVVVALDRSTGKELWRYRPVVHNYDSSPVLLQSGGKQFCIAGGYFMSCSDGKGFFIDENVKPAEMCPTPIIEGNVAFFGDSAGRLIWDKFEGGADGNLKVTRVNLIEFPFKDRGRYWDSAANYWTSSPLYVNGKVWYVSNQGRLVIVDVAKAAIVYDQKLDMNVNQYKTNVHGGYVVGVCASPTLAGKYVYLMDNCGGTMVFEPGDQPKLIAKNVIEQMVPPWEPGHWDSPHQECTISTPIFEGKKMYYRAEVYMYCIGEK